MKLGSVMELCASQHGVVSRQQIRNLGISDDALRRACQRSELVRVTRSTFRTGAQAETFELRCKAAELEVGRRGLLFGPTAARLLGMRAMPQDPIHVMIPNRRRITNPPWLVAHYSSWFDYRRDAFEANGITTANPMRTLYSLAAVFNQHRFERAAEDAWHCGLITPDAAREYLQQHRCRGKDGVATFERWLERVGTRTRATQSNLERRLIDALSALSLPEPERQYPLRLISGDLVHLDIAWPQVRLAVEPGHSWWHGGDIAQRRDQGRDRACSEVGWMVLRFDETVIDDIYTAARQVRQIYLRRRADLDTAS
ncbi:MAG: type IV toxin-antitoxin system AbiEi family antitoxin domain-containing protein [Actinomycetota bacterium]